jgi:uncharacterized delta-60 repeat protein
MRNLTPLTLSLIILSLAAAVPASAATPTLDLRWGDSGRVQGPFGLKDPAPLAVQADGNLVIGLARDVARMTPSGADTTFGSGGRAAIPTPAGQDLTVGLLGTGPAGRIYVAGMSGVKAPDGAADPYAGWSGYLAALKPDGSPDAAFGQNGVLRVPGIRGFGALTVDGDGNVLLAAGSDEGTVQVLRVLANGTLDPGFGTAGVAELALGRAGRTVFPRTIEILSGRRIVVAGGAEVSGRLDTNDDVDTRNYSWAIGQLKPDGSADGSFSGDGVTRISVGKEIAGRADIEEVRSIVPVGKGFVAVGSSDVGAGWNSHAALARFDADGKLHRSFGTRGRVVMAPLGDAAGAVRDARGRIFLAGGTWRKTGGAQRTLIARFSTTGKPDTTLGAGKGWTSFGFAGLAWELEKAGTGKVFVEAFNEGGTVIARMNTG